MRKKSAIWALAAVTFASAYSGMPAESVQARTVYEAAYAKTTTDKTQFAAKVVYLVNLERRQAGLKPLVIDAAVARTARLKAIDMSKKQYFDHTSPTYGSPFNMLKLQKIAYRAAGENIAAGQRSPESVMKSWMNSEGHRSNILNPNYTSIGAAYYDGYWVQLFIG
ncbi:hypothetical protein CDO73_07460 [Saccharibacillus sp. O23]|uniref:CAP domain-containing protein n=1 Tax=Saccharibacillus sp. O23 TaxID=2009338 RepID=UPI000B4E03E6|nr:hypothetical protein CDO73_07460 [Saccharibacillus sp. O23]